MPPSGKKVLSVLCPLTALFAQALPCFSQAVPTVPMHMHTMVEVHGHIPEYHHFNQPFHDHSNHVSSGADIKNMNGSNGNSFFHHHNFHHYHIVNHPSSYVNSTNNTSGTTHASVNNNSLNTGIHHSPSIWNNLLHNTNSSPSLNLDLSSTNANMTAGNLLHHNSITINIGGTPLIVDSNTKLTPAEYLAVRQVEFTGQQSLLIDSQGSASGGTVVLNSHLSQLINNLVIPQGVTVIDLTKSGTLNITGNITDYGNLYVDSKNPLLTDITLNANNISVQGHGILSDIIPSTTANLLHAQTLDNNLNLNLDAIHNIANAGTITSAGNLNLNAGNTIINAGTDTNPSGNDLSAPVIQAANAISLAAGSGNIINDGLITSAAGNINIFAQAPSTDINLQSNYGSLQALQGNINIRDNSYVGAGNIYINGGNYLSQNMNLYSGTGSIVGSAGNITGQFNSSAGAEHFNADTSNFILGNNSITGDPTFANTGDITISGAINPTENIAIIAGGNIVGDNSASISGGGIAITLVAGADITSGGGIGGQTINGSSSGVSSPVTFQFDSSHSGNIDFTLTGTSPVINSPGGNITLLANYAAPGTGNIWFRIGVISVETINAAGPGGNVLIVAGGQGGTASSGVINHSLQLNGILTQATGTTGANGGNINIYGANPVINGGSATYNTNGTLTSGSYPTSSSSYTFNNNGSLTDNNNITASGSQGTVGSSGGSIGGNGSTGGNGGSINIVAGSISLSAAANIISTGGIGGTGGTGTSIGGNGGTGGIGGTINLTSTSSTTTGGGISAPGGFGGASSSGPTSAGNGGTGGQGGNINISASSFTASSLFSPITAAGGQGGMGGNSGGGSSGNGGHGGSISITATSSSISVHDGLIATGGNGGNLGSGAFISGSGGIGGSINLTANSFIMVSANGVNAVGGNSVGADNQGNGGNGGTITLSANSYLLAGNVTASGGTPGIGFLPATRGNGGTLSISDSNLSTLNIGSISGSNYLSGQILATGEDGGTLNVSTASAVTIVGAGIVSANNGDPNGTGGLIQFANTTAGGAVTVANNGTIEVSQSGISSGIVGFNGGTSGAITITGSGTITAGQFVNVGNLNSTTLAIQAPYTTVNPFTGTYTAGNYSITQGTISGTLQVSNSTTPTPTPTPSSSTSSVVTTGLTPQQILFYDLSYLSLLASQQQQASTLLYEQIGTRIPTDYTPYTTYPMQPQLYPLHGNISVNKISSSMPGQALFAGSEFNANELTALSRAGIVFGPQSTNNFLDLIKGFVLFTPNQNIQVQTREGMVYIPKGTAAWVVETGNDCAIYDLHDNIHTGSIKVIINKKPFTLAPGKQLLLTRNISADFSELNPNNNLGYRNVRATDLGDSIKAFVCDFSINHSLTRIQVMPHLISSKNPAQKKIVNNLYKNAAIVADLNGYPDYKTGP